jgi:hypothetical protein
MAGLDFPGPVGLENLKVTLCFLKVTIDLWVEMALQYWLKYTLVL